LTLSPFVPVLGASRVDRKGVRLPLLQGSQQEVKQTPCLESLLPLPLVYPCTVFPSSCVFPLTVCSLSVFLLCQCLFLLSLSSLFASLPSNSMWFILIPCVSPCVSPCLSPCIFHLTVSLSRGPVFAIPNPNQIKPTYLLLFKKLRKSELWNTVQDFRHLPRRDWSDTPAWGERQRDRERPRERPSPFLSFSRRNNVSHFFFSPMHFFGVQKDRQFSVI